MTIGASILLIVIGAIQHSMWSKRSRRDITIEDRREPTDPRY